MLLLPCPHAPNPPPVATISTSNGSTAEPSSIWDLSSMSLPARSTPRSSPLLPSLAARTDKPLAAVRDRDYLLDRHGVIFKVIGDVHPESHYLGYVKYYPDSKGDR